MSDFREMTHKLSSLHEQLFFVENALTSTVIAIESAQNAKKGLMALRLELQNQIEQLGPRVTPRPKSEEVAPSTEVSPAMGDFLGKVYGLEPVSKGASILRFQSLNQEVPREPDPAA